MFKIFFTIFFFSVGGFLFGQDYEPTSKEKKAAPPPKEKVLNPYPCCNAPSFSHKEPEQRYSLLQVGATDCYVSVSPSAYPTTRGNLAGVYGTYTYQAPDTLYAGVRAVWSQGITHGSGTSRSILNLLLEERLGYTWSTVQRESRVSLFSGFGGRALMELVKVHPSSVTFDYLEWYFPLGVSWVCLPYEWLSVGILGEWMFQIYPTVRISPLHGARWILNAKLANFLVQAPIGFIFSRFTFTVEPFFEFWNDGHVSAETENGINLHVPGNQYVFAGLNLSLGVYF